LGARDALDTLTVERAAELTDLIIKGFEGSILSPLGGLLKPNSERHLRLAVALQRQ
jgi:hypothetical protein